MGTHTLALQALKPVSEAALAGPFMQLFTLVYVKFFFTPCKTLVIKLQTAPSTWDEEGTLKKKNEYTHKTATCLTLPS